MIRKHTVRRGSRRAILMALALLTAGILIPPARSQEATPPAAPAPATAPANGEETIPKELAAEVARDHEKEEHAGGHSDPVTPLLLGLTMILVAAKAGGALMVKMGQPAVLGELLVGVVMGNAVLFNPDWTWFEFMRLPPPEAAATETADSSVAAELQHDHEVASKPVATTLDMLARIGVILLLFEVGLESNLGDMRRVGASAFLVAILGVVVPLILGWFVGKSFIPDQSWHVHLFLGATLCATSVGITARVLKDLGKMDRKESQIVLGAAVIDDVMGLVVLAVVQAIIIKGSASLEEVALISGKAVGFLVGAVILGEFLFPHLYKLVARLKGHGLLTVVGLLVCFFLSWVAAQVGLAPIVGAFAAGLILDERHYVALKSKDHDSMEEMVMPITTMLVPIFFVMMGFTVDLRSFADMNALGLAVAITVAAIIGKQVCSLGPIERGLDRLSIGIGMIPRGEVGLIFAAIGRELKVNGVPVVGPTINTAIVVMVIVTTLITPPMLGWSMSRKRSPAST